ncbi:ferrochelatase [Halocynthiibacter namhaensis]|uniref:ferrochelatase n=1 Tax=Halocynthiibacter namhaensis TaxID=1290553 RepID=UPI000579126A|nr:ferrochelatase [Halocynthiibacter namhaensis]
MLPNNHPTLPTAKTGILVANLGTPDGYDYWSMRRYLDEFLSDPRVVDTPRWKWLPILKLIILSFRPFTSGKAYKSIWNEDQGESPLMTITRAQTDALREQLAAQYGDKVQVEFTMRYGNPSIVSKVREMVENGCERILFFPLYPQYAGATTATANDAFFAALKKETMQPASRTVPAYFAHPAYVDALATSVEHAYAQMETRPDHLIASYHGMPHRYLTQGDPYHCHCVKSTRLLKERLGWEDGEIISTFQSRFGVEEWLKPYTVEEVARLAKAGKKNIAVIAPAFSADCIETLEEVNEEIGDAFKEAGGESFTYIPCLNDQDIHIQALTQIINENLHGWV